MRGDVEVLADSGFRAYGAAHLGVIALLVTGTAAAVLLGRRHRGDGSTPTNRVLALALLAVIVPMQVLILRSPDFVLLEQLPVQLCDLAVFVAAYALWRCRPWAVALTYYWGLTLIPQAVLTPALAQDFPSLGFSLFWAMHLWVFWAAVYLTWGQGLAPSWRSYRIAVALTACWMAGVLVLNAVMDSNYGYLNAKPSTGSILDYLGPWPAYVVAEVAIVATVWALLTWPWVRRRRAAPSRSEG